MRYLILAALTILAFLPRCYACLNHYQRDLVALKVGEDALGRITTPADNRVWEEIRSGLTERLRTSRDVETMNDLAVAMIHTGSTEEAIPLLEEIELTTPGLYQTATNLGTAYELLGQPQEALKWIQKGISINPNSHGSSEWIHVAVLKAKLAMEKDPKWIENNRVLGMDFGARSFPRGPTHLPTGNRGERLSKEEVQAALEQQLRERLQFVSPPDEIVAQLLIDYANLTVIKTDAKEAGFPIFRRARDYATTATSTAIIHKRLPSEPPTFLGKRIEWGFSITALCIILVASIGNVRETEKKHRPGAVDERYNPFPPFVTVLLGLIVLLWTEFSKSLDLPPFVFFLSMIALASCCGSIIILSRKGEKQRRQIGVDPGFTYQSFTFSTVLFAAAWILVSYWSIMS